MHLANIRLYSFVQSQYLANVLQIEDYSMFKFYANGTLLIFESIDTKLIDAYLAHIECIPVSLSIH